MEGLDCNISTTDIKKRLFISYKALGKEDLVKKYIYIYIKDIYISPSLSIYRLTPIIKKLCLSFFSYLFIIVTLANKI